MAAKKKDNREPKPEKEKPDYPDTPSGKALAEVGNLDGEDVSPDEVEKALEHGEAYQKAKRAHRWG